MWRVTIGTLDEGALAWWEPGAPSARERIDALALAHRSGYRTSVSSEPMLGTDQRELYDTCSPHVTDSIWFGRANGLIAAMRRAGCTDSEVERGRALLAIHSDDYLRGLHRSMRDLQLVRWKESIKRVVGLAVSTTAGCDL